MVFGPLVALVTFAVVLVGVMVALRFSPVAPVSVPWAPGARAALALRGGLPRASKPPMCPFRPTR